MKQYFVFECRKCRAHHAYIEKKEVHKIVKLEAYDCPACGEEGYCNWIYYGEGSETGFKKMRKKK